MKILHLPSTFFPEHTGGKEVFVANVIAGLPEAEHLVVIHKNLLVAGQYSYQNIIVKVLPLAQSADLRRSYYSLEYESLSGFELVLDTFKPDIVHFHDLSENASLTHLIACKSRGIRTLTSYHSPGQSCLQRALLFSGETPCDGKIDVTRCTYCRFIIRSVPPVLAAVASRISLPLDRGGKYVLRHGTSLYARAWKRFYQMIDGVQIHTHWVRDMLMLNGIPEQKIRYLEMGGTPSLDFDRDRIIGNPLRLVFVGRCSDSKGIHVLISAIRLLPREANVEIHFFGPRWDDSEYGRTLIKLVEADDRFQPPVLLQPDQVVPQLTTMDACLIPSIWPETGPFVLFDAFAAGLPIIGSDFAGIAERVEHGVNGLLFEWGNAQDMANQIMTLINTPEMVTRLRQNLRSNRTFGAMAKDFLQLYTLLLNETRLPA